MLVTTGVVDVAPPVAVAEMGKEDADLLLFDDAGTSRGLPLLVLLLSLLLLLLFVGLDINFLL